MNKLLIIHPADPSTDFLKRVSSALTEKFPEQTILVNPDFEYGIKAMQDDLEKYEDYCLVFLGHGYSTYLGGSIDKSSKIIPLVNIEEGQLIFSNRNVVLFSCFSSSFLKKADDGIKSYIGCGNMPSELKEVTSNWNISKSFSDLCENTIGYYRNILVDMFQESLESFLQTNGSFRQLYLAQRLVLNKSLLDLVSIGEFSLYEKQALFKAIQQTKEDLVLKY